MATLPLAAAPEWGIDNPSPIGAYLDGVLPSTTPQSGDRWMVEDAFPNIDFTNTLVIASNPGDARLYVGTRDGLIQSFDNDPDATDKSIVIDLRDRVAVVWDGGFLGMAFHPDFGMSGWPYERTFYAYYSSHCPYDPGSESVDFGNCHDGYPRDPAKGFYDVYLRLARYQVVDAQAERLVGDIASEDVLFNLRLINKSHRGGGLAFGNDRYLYLAIGDQMRYNTAQDIERNFEGGVLRLAVDVTEDDGETWECPAGSHSAPRLMQDVGEADEMSGRLYCIPDDKPWVGRADTFEEYFALGHRNPHRLAIDPDNGRLWTGEAGEQTREEIKVLCKGCNFGWPFREGLVPGPKKNAGDHHRHIDRPGNRLRPSRGPNDNRRLRVLRCPLS